MPLRARPIFGTLFAAVVSSTHLAVLAEVSGCADASAEEECAEASLLQSQGSLLRALQRLPEPEASDGDDAWPVRADGGGGRAGPGPTPDEQWQTPAQPPNAAASGSKGGPRDAASDPPSQEPAIVEKPAVVVTVPLDSNLQVPNIQRSAPAPSDPDDGRGQGSVDVKLSSQLQERATTQRLAATKDSGVGKGSSIVAATLMGSRWQAARLARAAARGLANDSRLRSDHTSQVETSAARLGSAPNATHAGSSGTAAHGLLIGILYGVLHVVEPDHIGTLVTLSAAATPARAFKAGAFWAFGHSIGMVAVASVFLLMGHLASGAMQKWEHYGNYVIGASMIAVALYFAFTESSRVETREDGTTIMLPCDCCVDPALSPEFSKSQQLANSPIAVPCPPVSSTGNSRADSQTAPPTAPHGVEGILLGIVQGVCSPSGLLGVSFMAELPVQGVILFTFAYMVFSVLSTGILAAGWGVLTRRGCGDSVSPHGIYRASYVFTLLLGIGWLAATYFGLLNNMDTVDESVAGQSGVNKA